ncbi:hypothetical protein BTUL_0213g00030 [Botrytis tulipae]|uniref:Uncharacterized protein n=1 Tax=Botrytis tulipae TaxID=87230 RepID=A0A4Z1E8A2_9HELO|nr:hypothetical protein BTUL_0213g00030 [Botrytis tulipae]
MGAIPILLQPGSSQKQPEREAILIGAERSLFFNVISVEASTAREHAQGLKGASSAQLRAIAQWIVRKLDIAQAKNNKQINKLETRPLDHVIQLVTKF